MTFIEFIKDLIDSGKERIKTPLTSTFFIVFTIYNWRPISFFLLSSKSIEDKISLINTAYCQSKSFYMPLLYTLSYMVIVPLFSAGLERLLFWPTSLRRANQNREQKDMIKNELNLVKDQLKLQDARSSNKEKEEMLKKIADLEYKNMADKDTHEAIVNDYMSQVSQLSERLKDAVERKENNTQDLRKSQDGAYDLMIYANSLSTIEIDKLRSINSEFIDKSSFSNKLLKFMIKYDFFDDQGDQVELTVNGIDFIEYLKNKFQKFII